ncbi:MAG TPA: hypothetical protein GX702_01300 [Chloroflexi bacterium]|jgi:hypothetical protein|nr:hypothetical protein [Chloroflexota bacterium]
MDKLLNLLRPDRRRSAPTAREGTPEEDAKRDLLTTYGPMVRSVLKALCDTRYHSCSVVGPEWIGRNAPGHKMTPLLRWSICYTLSQPDEQGVAPGTERRALLDVSLLVDGEGSPRYFLCRGIRHAHPLRARLDADSLAGALARIDPAVSDDALW